VTRGLNPTQWSRGIGWQPDHGVIDSLHITLVDELGRALGLGDLPVAGLKRDMVGCMGLTDQHNIDIADPFTNTLTLGAQRRLGPKPQRHAKPLRGMGVDLVRSTPLNRRLKLVQAWAE